MHVNQSITGDVSIDASTERKKGICSKNPCRRKVKDWRLLRQNLFYMAKIDSDRIGLIEKPSLLQNCAGSRVGTP